MPRVNRFTPTGLAVALAAAALPAGCQRGSEGRPPAPGRTPVARVETVRPERRAVRRTVGEPGQIQGFETTALFANVQGYVKRWNVNIGDSVKKGQVLVEIAVPELEAELRQKRAAVEQAAANREQSGAAVKVAEADVAAARARLDEVRAGVSRVQADLARWRSEFTRVEQLFQDRAQTGSLLDETRNKLRSAEAAEDEVGAQVRSAEVGRLQSQAALDRARSDLGAAAAAIDVAREDARRVESLLGYSRIEAPFDGVVTRRNVDTGQLTHPGPIGEPLYVVSRSDVVTVAVAVPEAFAPELDLGDRAEVKLQAMRGRVVVGKLSRVSWALDPKTRTIGAEIDLPNPGGALLPGLYAYVVIVVEEHPDALTVPTTAVAREGGQTWCVAIVDGRAARRPVQVGLDDGARAEIVSGLEIGDAVVKANAASLVDGQPVEVVDPPPAPASKP